MWFARVGIIYQAAVELQRLLLSFCNVDVRIIDGSSDFLNVAQSWFPQLGTLRIVPCHHDTDKITTFFYIREVGEYISKILGRPCPEKKNSMPQ